MLPQGNARGATWLILLPLTLVVDGGYIPCRGINARGTGNAEAGANGWRWDERDRYPHRQGESRRPQPDDMTMTPTIGLLLLLVPRLLVGFDLLHPRDVSGLLSTTAPLRLK